MFWSRLVCWRCQFHSIFHSPLFRIVSDVRLSIVVLSTTLCRFEQNGNSFPFVNYIKVHIWSALIVKNCNFVTTHKNEIQLLQGNLDSIQNNIVHSFYHALVGHIITMFVKVVFNFEELEKWFHTFEICHGSTLL